MNTEVTIRQARHDEISWINRKYDQIDFKQSYFDNEVIAIAEVNGKNAGLGRLQNIEDKVGELGGMYVDENFRGYGLASKIVAFLIANSEQYQRIFCLPFSHLEKFYKKYGFNPVIDTTHTPNDILKKHSLCNSTYENKVLLYVLEK